MNVILLSFSRNSVWRTSEAALMAHLENIVSNLLPLKGKLITKDIWQGASVESFNIFFPIRSLKCAENRYIFVHWYNLGGKKKSLSMNNKNARFDAGPAIVRLRNMSFECPFQMSEPLGEIFSWPFDSLKCSSFLTVVILYFFQIPVWQCPCALFLTF